MDILAKSLFASITLFGFLDLLHKNNKKSRNIDNIERSIY